MAARLWLWTAGLPSLVLGSSTAASDGVPAQGLEGGTPQLGGHGQEDLIALLQRPPVDVKQFRSRFPRGGHLGDILRGENGSALSPVLAEWPEQWQREIALDISPGATPPAKNKVILVLVEVFGLGIWGVDRCYMGQRLLGVAKGMTAGGFLVWAFVDYVLIAVNSLASQDDLHAFGFRASFESHWQVVASFWLALVLLAAKCLVLCAGQVHKGRGLAWRTTRGVSQAHLEPLLPSRHQVSSAEEASAEAKEIGPDTGDECPAQAAQEAPGDSLAIATPSASVPTYPRSSGELDGGTGGQPFASPRHPLAASAVAGEPVSVLRSPSASSEESGGEPSAAAARPPSPSVSAQDAGSLPSAGSRDAGSQPTEDMEEASRQLLSDAMITPLPSAGVHEPATLLRSPSASTEESEGQPSAAATRRAHSASAQEAGVVGLREAGRQPLAATAMEPLSSADMERAGRHLLSAATVVPPRSLDAGEPERQPSGSLRLFALQLARAQLARRHSLATSLDAGELLRSTLAGAEDAEAQPSGSLALSAAQVARADGARRHALAASTEAGEAAPWLQSPSASAEESGGRPWTAMTWPRSPSTSAHGAGSQPSAGSREAGEQQLAVTTLAPSPSADMEGAGRQMLSAATVTPSPSPNVNEAATLLRSPSTRSEEAREQLSWRAQPSGSLTLVASQLLRTEEARRHSTASSPDAGEAVSWLLSPSASADESGEQASAAATLTLSPSASSEESFGQPSAATRPRSLSASVQETESQLSAVTTLTPSASAGSREAGNQQLEAVTLAPPPSAHMEKAERQPLSAATLASSPSAADANEAATLLRSPPASTWKSGGQPSAEATRRRLDAAASQLGSPSAGAQEGGSQPSASTTVASSAPAGVRESGRQPSAAATLAPSPSTKAVRRTPQLLSDATRASSSAANATESARQPSPAANPARSPAPLSTGKDEALPAFSEGGSAPASGHDTSVATRPDRPLDLAAAASVVITLQRWWRRHIAGQAALLEAFVHFFLELRLEAAIQVQRWWRRWLRRRPSKSADL